MIKPPVAARRPIRSEEKPMQDRKKRLWCAVLAVMLPGPWTPAIVLAYLLGRTVERGQDTAHHDEPPAVTAS